MPYTILTNGTPYADEQKTIAFTRAIALALNETIHGQILQVCPQCHSSKVMRNGGDRLTNGDRRQRYKCKDCDRRWREDPVPCGRKRIMGDRTLTGAELVRRHRAKKKDEELSDEGL